MTRRDANRNSVDALTTTAILAWSEPEYVAIPQYQQHLITSIVCQYVPSSPTTPTAE
jgi:hypothetical protein